MKTTSHIYLLLLALIRLAPSQAVDAATAASRPNIIVIMSDDMGYSDIGCYGGEIATPNLDRLAKNGLRFTQFYNTARCCPTRAALLTGLYSHQAGIGHMMEDRGYDGYRGDLNRQCVTIAEALRAAGYRNYAVGKWHVTPAGNAAQEARTHNWPLQRGFDRYYGTIHGAGSFFDPSSLVRDNTMITAASDPEYRPREFYYTDAISDHAIRFIREHSSDHSTRPFFMYVTYTAAHWPMHAKSSDIAKYKDRYDGGYEPVRNARWEKQKKLGVVDAKWRVTPVAEDWERVKNKEFESRCMEVYAAMIDCMDQGIGRIVTELQRQHQIERTLIFFLQDNGGCAEGTGRGTNFQARADGPTLPAMAPEDRQHNSVPKQTRDGWAVRQGYGVMPGGPDTYIAYGRGWANVSNTPFREYKHWEHEGGISTPLIVHWPQGVARTRHGKLIQEPGHLIDIMATCLDVAGAKYPTERAGQRIHPMQGVSLKPAFAGKPLGRSQPIFFEHEGNRAVRDGRWKLVAKENQPWELYDMVRDRSETDDLASTHPAEVQTLTRKWDDWAAQSNVLPLGGWRGSSAKVSDAKEFVLRPGDDLSGEQRPNVARRAFRITVEIAEPGRDGVLIAQGGSSHGFALYLKGGVLHFAVRRGGELRLVAGRSDSISNARSFAATLGVDGSVTLAADGREVATGKIGGPLNTLPTDGLQVGHDANGAVGDYAAPFQFDGKVISATLTIE